MNVTQHCQISMLILPPSKVDEYDRLAVAPFTYPYSEQCDSEKGRRN